MLLLCYVFPPLAVLLMGRPFSSILNMFLTFFLFWIPGIKHALICYADWKMDRRHNQSVQAINFPAWFGALSQPAPQQPRSASRPALPVAYTPEQPHVGAKGTVFRRK